jgi:hypothetical protein
MSDAIRREDVLRLGAERTGYLFETLRSQAESPAAPGAPETCICADDGNDPECKPWQPPIPLNEVPDVEPFPFDVLPEQLAAFVQEAARALNCPPDYVAVPMLALAGAGIGTTRALQVKRGWQERPCQYAAVIGPPGGAKTPALKITCAPVYAEQARRWKAYRQAKKEWKEKDEEFRGEEPRMETLFVCDVTTEKLAEILEENPRGVVMIRDELTGWVAGMDQYRAKGRGSDRQFYLSAWAGEPVKVDRKNKDEPVFVPHPWRVCRRKRRRHGSAC